MKDNNYGNNKKIFKLKMSITTITQCCLTVFCTTDSCLHMSHPVDKELNNAMISLVSAQCI